MPFFRPHYLGANFISSEVFIFLVGSLYKFYLAIYFAGFYYMLARIAGIVSMEGDGRIIIENVRPKWEPYSIDQVIRDLLMSILIVCTLPFKIQMAAITNNVLSCKQNKYVVNTYDSSYSKV